MTSGGFAKVVVSAFALVLAYQVVKTALPAPKSTVAWLTSYSTARAQSATTRKPLILLFSAGWCDSCRILKRTTLVDSRVEALLKEGVAVEINVDDPENRALVSEFQVRGIPAIHVVSGDGNPVSSIVGVVSPSEFIARLAPSIVQ